jgi:hypothetical protein
MNEYLEYLGYIASAIVLISLLMTSIKKLRWINLVGALLFGIYGFMIQSIPTGVMNLGIVVIDIYFLVKMYKNKDYFKILKLERNSEYLQSFMDFYKDDMKQFQAVEEIENKEFDVKLFTLRNMNPAGLLLGNIDNDTFNISLDYAVPQYRDFKLAMFLFEDKKEFFTSKGIKRLVALKEEDKHNNYLEKIGFTLQEFNGKTVYVKEI